MLARTFATVAKLLQEGRYRVVIPAAALVRVQPQMNKRDERRLRLFRLSSRSDFRRGRGKS